MLLESTGRAFREGVAHDVPAVADEFFAVTGENPDIGSVGSPGFEGYDE